MSKVVNLRTIRKQAARDAKRAAGSESAARYGRTLSQRSTDKAAVEKAQAHLDAHKRET